MRTFVLLVLALMLGGASVAGAQDGKSLPNLAWLDELRAVPDTPFLIANEELGDMSLFKGKAVVLNFWATWCPPCIAEMPTLNRLAEEHGGDDLVVVTMAMDRASEEQIAAFYEQIDAAHLGIYRDPQMHFGRAMHVFGLPTTVLIDHNGYVVAQLVGEADWAGEAALEAILPLAEAARDSRTALEQAGLAD